MSFDGERRRFNIGGIVAGIILIMLGGFFLLLQIAGPVLDVDVGHYF
jgi:hypothetical protein